MDGLSVEDLLPDDFESFIEGEISIDTEFEIILEDIGCETSGKAFSCNSCGKKYITNGGLKRHLKLKHTISPNDIYENINHIDFNKIIIDAKEKLAIDKCLPHFEDTFKNLIVTIKEIEEIKNVFMPVIAAYKGDAEKFYSGCYQVLSQGTHIFQGLPLELSTLLCSEVSNLCLSSLVCGKQGEDERLVSNVNKFSEKDIHCIQYLSGYCFRTVYQKIRRKKQWESDYSQQCLSVLKAAKLESAEGQPLILSRDKGGLWAVGNQAIEMFKSCEKEFCRVTRKSVHTIDTDRMLSTLMSNPYVISNFDDICKSADCFVTKEISKNLLQALLLLYIRVRAHSYARKIMEQHKFKLHKSSGKKSLRKTIKQASGSNEVSSVV